MWQSFFESNQGALCTAGVALPWISRPCAKEPKKFKTKRNHCQKVNPSIEIPNVAPAIRNQCSFSFFDACLRLRHTRSHDQNVSLSIIEGITCCHMTPNNTDVVFLIKGITTLEKIKISFRDNFSNSIYSYRK